MLKRGVQGMGKGSLQAGNDIVTKFMESCNAKAGHTINTGSSLHSNLIAGDSVIVSGRKGFLIGGNVCAGKRIEASVFGNKMNTATNLKVGVEPDVMKRFKELAAIIKEKQDKQLESRQMLEMFKKKMLEGHKLLPIQITMAKQAGADFKKLSEELEKDSAEYMFLKQEIENNTDGRIVANHTIYPGVTLIISNRVYPIKDVLSRCQFRMSEADVVSLPV